MSPNDSSAGAAKIVALCLGEGGIPKRQVHEAEVEALGLVGDKHRFPLHGGADRAICLISTDTYESLREDDVDCETPGTFGENVLTEGLDELTLRPGHRLRLGDEVVVEIHDVRIPCMTLKSVDPRFPDLMLGRSGWVCRVVQTGTLRLGMSIQKVT